MSKHYHVIPRQHKQVRHSDYYPRYCCYCRTPFETYDPFQKYCCEECQKEHFDSLPKARNMNIISLIGNGLVQIVQKVFNRTETETIVEHTPYGTRTITRQVNVSVTQTEIIHRNSR